MDIVFEFSHIMETKVVTLSIVPHTVVSLCIMTQQREIHLRLAKPVIQCSWVFTFVDFLRQSLSLLDTRNFLPWRELKNFWKVSHFSRLFVYPHERKRVEKKISSSSPKGGALQQGVEDRLFSWHFFEGLTMMPRHSFDNEQRLIDDKLLSFVASSPLEEKRGSKMRHWEMIMLSEQCSSLARLCHPNFARSRFRDLLMKTLRISMVWVFLCLASVGIFPNKRSRAFLSIFLRIRWKLQSSTLQDLPQWWKIGHPF